MLDRVRDQLAEHQRHPVANASGSPTSTEVTDRRAIAAAPVPPGIENETGFASVMARGRDLDYAGEPACSTGPRLR
jgi:hypothetical protein